MRLSGGLRGGTGDGKKLRRNAGGGYLAEALEARWLLSDIVWLNRGSTSSDSDNFNSVFGSNSNLARSVVDAAILSWQNIITDFHFSDGFQAYLLTISMASTGTSNGAGTAPPKVDSKNVPYQTTITIGRGSDTKIVKDGNGNGGNWYLNPHPFDLADFGGLNSYGKYNAFGGTDALENTGATNDFDLYSIVAHEIGHAMGIYAANPRFKALSADTGVIDTVSNFQLGTNPPVGDFWVFNGPDIQTLMSAYNSGGNTNNAATDAGGPEHYAYQTSQQTLNGITYVGKRDLMNAVGTNGERKLISDNDLLMLKDAYGYSVNLPSSFGTFYDFLQSNGSLQITTPNGTSSNGISISQSGSTITVTLAIGNGVAGDPSIITSTFNAANVSSINIVGTTSTVNNITLSNLGNIPITLDAGLLSSGSKISTLTINTDNTSHTQIHVTQNQITGAFGGTVTFHSIARITINGGSGNDTVFYGAGDIFGLVPITFNGGAGSNQFDVQNFNSATNWSYSPSSTEFLGFNNALAYTADEHYSNVQTLVIDASTVGDALSVDGMPSGFTVFFFGGAGNDSLSLGDTDPDGFSFSENGGNVSFSGGGGVNSIFADDIVAPATRSYTVNNGQLFSNVSGTVTYDAQVQSVTLRGPGGFAGTFTVNGVRAGNTVNLLGGPKNDLFTVNAASGSTFNIAAPLNITGGGGTDTLAYTDAGYTGSTIAPINLAPTTIDQGAFNVATTYSGIASLTLTGAPTSSPFNVFGTSPGITGQTTIFAGAGSNLITVYPHDASGNLTIATNIGIAGQGGSDTLLVDDSGSPWPIDYVFSNPFGAGTQDIGGLGAALVGAGSDVENIAIHGGDAGNTFDVNSFKSGSALSILAGAGNDVLNLGNNNLPTNITSISSFNFDGQAGFDLFNMNNTAEPNQWLYTTTTTGLSASRSSGAGYSLSLGVVGVEQAAINAGAATNSFNASGAAAGEEIDFNGGSGNDSLLFGAVETGVNGVLVFNGGAGSNFITQLIGSSGTVPVTVHLVQNELGGYPGDTFFGAGGAAVFNSVGSITLTLGNGADTVFVEPNASATINIRAANPTTSPGDSLVLLLDGVVNPVLHGTPASGSVTSDNRLTLTYSQFESGPVIDTPPEILSTTFVADDAEQSFVVTFSEAMIDPGAASLELVNESTGQVFSSDNITETYDGNALTATYSFAPGTLDAGVYSAVLPAVNFHDVANNPLMMDSIYSFLWVPAGGMLAQTPGGGVVYVQQVAIGTGGIFDLADNSMIVDYSGDSPIASIQQWLASGFNGGAWNGAGIQSSAAAADPQSMQALGYAEASDLGAAPFHGFGVDSTAVLVGYTRYGDNNLDGTVDVGNDFALLLDGLAMNGSSWVMGDYTYDGKVDLGNDTNLFLGSYLSSAAPAVRAARSPAKLGSTVAAVSAPTMVAVPAQLSESGQGSLFDQGEGLFA